MQRSRVIEIAGLGEAPCRPTPDSPCRIDNLERLGNELQVRERVCDLLLTFERCCIDWVCTYFGAVDAALDDLNRKSDLWRARSHIACGYP
jgi:hypothetical protein